MYKTNTKRQRCLNCFKELDVEATLFELFYSQDPLCHSCRSLLEINHKTFECEGVVLTAFYVYNDQASQWMMQIKEAHDISLAPVFIHPFINKIRKRVKNKTMIMVPSSKRKTEERGYHALNEMFKPLKLECKDVFIKDDVKQSKGKKKQRQEISQHIHLKDPSLKYGPIVLVDDICTTGESLKACIHALKEQVESIEIIVLCIHPLWLHNKFQD